MTNHTKGLLLTALGVILMSTESPLIKYSGLSSANISFVFGISIMIATNLMLLTKGRSFFINSYKIQFKGVFLSGFFMGLSNYFFINAVYYTGIAKTVLILATAPVITALIAYIFLKQKTPKRIFVATIFVFLGLYIILSNDLAKNSIIGNLFAFACVLVFSSLFCTLSYNKKASRVGYVSFGGFFVILFSLYNVNIDFSISSYLPIIIMGILITPLSSLFIGLGTIYLIPAESGLLVIGESILAPIWGWLWLDETINTSVFIGGGIILATLVINSLASLRD